MATTEQPKGIKMAGTVNDKIQYPGKDGKKDSYALDIAIPKCSKIIRLFVKKEDYDRHEINGYFSSLVGVSEYKGQLQFSIVQ